MNGPASPRRRILASFLLGIALPSGLLGYLAFRGIQNDQALLERERRSELGALAASLSTAVDERLGVLEASLDSILRTAGAPATARGSGKVHGELEELRRAEPLVDAVFHLDGAGTIDVVAGGIGSGPRSVPGRPASTRPGWPEWERARLLELRDRRVEAALVAYRDMLPRAPVPEYEADILAAIGRAESNVGRHRQAAEVYARLANEHADRTTTGGLPYGVVSGLEGARALVLAGDTAAALRTLAAVHLAALRPDRPLTRPQLEFVTGRAREMMTAVVAGSGMSGRFAGAAWADTLARLESDAAAASARAGALDEFRDAGARLIPGGAAPHRMLIEAGGREFHVLLRGQNGADGPARWGVLLDAGVLRDGLVVPLVEEAANAAGASWALRTRAGATVAIPGSDPVGPPLIAAALPAPVSSWTLELRRRSPGLAEALLTSRRGVYFYAFLLLAGILAFGLTLTIRSVNQELRLARMQSDFVSTISHEFKSPLTAIRQFTEMLQADRVPSEERRRQYYDVLLEQSERLSMLIDNVLDFARMEEGGRTLDIDVVAPSDLVTEAAAAARRRVGHEGFRIETRVAGELPAVAADRGAIGQALGNLIDNALRYSGEARDVVIHGYRENGQVVLAVQDFGIGLKSEDAARVFDRFFRAGDPLTRTVKGTGLGLTLVKQIAEAHGGTVAVESRPGQGSTFLLRLPAARAPLAVYSADTREERWSGS